MLIPIYYVKDAKVRMRAVMNEIEKEVKKQESTEIDIKPEALRAIKNKYFTIATDMLTAFREILAVFIQHNMTFNWLLRGQNIVNVIETTNRDLGELSLENLKDALERLMQAFGDEEELQSLRNTGLYDNSYSRRYSGYFRGETDFDQTMLRNMIESIHTNEERTINILDASMRAASNMALVKTYKETPMRTFAIGVPEDDSYYYRNANFDRIALGSMKGASISNEVFDVLVLSPNVSLEKDMALLSEKKERVAIKESVKYLRPGGVLILSLPKFRFHKDVCTVLAKFYTNFQVRLETDPVRPHYVYMTAIKKPSHLSKEIDEEAYNLLRSLHSKNDIKRVTQEPFEQIVLPDGELSIPLFRGSILNKDELKDIVNASPCLNNFLSGQLKSSDAQRMREPLLPFTTGQLGLVLTSGALDGIIDEGNGHYHVVKGRVVKDKQTTREENTEENSVTYTDTIANRVEITAITADGTVKRLA